MARYLCRTVTLSVPLLLRSHRAVSYAGDTEHLRHSDWQSVPRTVRGESHCTSCLHVVRPGALTCPRWACPSMRQDTNLLPSTSCAKRLPFCCASLRGHMKMTARFLWIFLFARSLPSLAVACDSMERIQKSVQVGSACKRKELLLVGLGASCYVQSRRCGFDGVADGGCSSRNGYMVWVQVSCWCDGALTRDLGHEKRLRPN
jgi:hypothetical protein